MSANTPGGFIGEFFASALTTVVKGRFNNADKRREARKRKVRIAALVVLLLLAGYKAVGYSNWKPALYNRTQPVVMFLEQHNIELPPKIKELRDSWAPKLPPCGNDPACVGPLPAPPLAPAVQPTLTPQPLPPQTAPATAQPNVKTPAGKKPAKKKRRQPKRPPAKLSPRLATGDSIIAAATRWIGAPYSWGGGSGSGPTFGSAARSVHTLGFDCSGLTYYVLRQVGVYSKAKKRNNAYQQFMDPQGVPVSANNLRAGDLIFFGWTAKSGGRTVYHVGHVGIYDGAGKVINAPHTGTVIQLTPRAAFKSPHEHFVGARRFAPPGLRPRR